MGDGVYDDPMFMLFVVGGTAISMISFLSFAVPLTYLGWRDPAGLRTYRIQRRGPSHPGRMVLRGLAVWLLNNVLLFGLIAATWPWLQASSGIHAGEPPAWWVVLGQVVFFIYLDDFLYYFMHRTMHKVPWLWKRIHTWHHRTKTPWAISGHDMHPLEFVATSALMLVGPLALGCHVLVLWVWIVVRQLEAAEGHCGYDFPLSITRLLPGSDGARHHDAHHARVQGNYAGFLAYLDGWFGTYSRGYEQDRRERK